MSRTFKIKKDACSDTTATISGKKKKADVPFTLTISYKDGHKEYKNGIWRGVGISAVDMKVDSIKNPDYCQ